jgi:hypothetical protein
MKVTEKTFVKNTTDRRFYPLIKLFTRILGNNFQFLIEGIVSAALKNYFCKLEY